MPKSLSQEKANQKAILDYLSLKGYMCWRNNSGAFMGDGGRFYRFGTLGSPDIICVKHPTGQFIGIEVKDSRGKQSYPQREFQERLERAGGRYILARSLDDVVGVL